MKNKVNIKTMATFVILQMLLFNSNIYANDLLDTKMVEGTLDLINDVIEVLKILIGAGTVGFLLYEAMKMRSADEQDKKINKKNMKYIVGIGAFSLFVAEIIDVVMGYYM